MRVLICGGREFDDWRKFSDFLWEILKEKDVVNQSYFEKLDGKDIYIIHGGADGADFCAHLWAKIWGFPEVRFPADWKQFGRAAGSIRNQQMLDEGKPDLVIAFPGGVGTADMVKRAKKAEVEVIEV